MLKHLLTGAAALVVATAANAQSYAIQAGRLIVDAAQSERGASTVIVENGRISRIETGFTAPAGAIVVDQRSRTVLPGMTDAHVHLTDTSGEPWYAGFTKKKSVPYAATVGFTHALEMAQGGFTSVRDLGGDTSAVIAVRDAVAEGRFPGPADQGCWRTSVDHRGPCGRSDWPPARARRRGQRSTSQFVGLHRSGGTPRRSCASSPRPEST